MEFPLERSRDGSRDWSFQSSRSFDVGVIIASIFFALALSGVSYKHLYLLPLDSWMHDANSAGLACAFLGGILTSLFAVYSIVTFADVTVSVFPGRHLISFKRKYLTRVSTENYPFSAISGIRVNSASGGKRSSIYRLTFRLKDGRVIQSGKQSFNEKELVQLAEHLIADIGCSDSNDLPFQLYRITVHRVFVSAIGAVVFYVAFYRLHSGKLCSAMWIGAPPLVIIGFSFAFLLLLARRLIRD